jgi:hypothetical protein
MKIADVAALVRDGKVLISDGPFAEAKEQIGGYCLIDCKDLDEAIEVASQIPGARTGGGERVPRRVLGDVGPRSARRDHGRHRVREASAPPHRAGAGPEPRFDRPESWSALKQMAASQRWWKTGERWVPALQATWSA